MVAVQPPRAAMLLGEVAVVLGVVVVEAPAPGIAIALSAGRFPKSGPVFDANEDAVMIVTDERATLAAVADAHFGAAAGRAAITALHASAAAILTHGEGDSRRLAGHAFETAIAAVAAALASDDDRGPVSRTALTVAGATGGSVTVVTAGDTVAMRARGGAGRRMGGTSEFLGPDGRTRHRNSRSTRLTSGDCVVIMSDGASDYIGPSWVQRVASMTEGAPPAVIVRRVVDAAFAGGAGDHVAVAAFTPPDDMVPGSRRGQW